jgi:mono/diheme cytochrome c family protein
MSHSHDDGAQAEVTMSPIKLGTQMLAGFVLAGLAAVPIVAGAAPTAQQRVKFDGSDVFRTYCVVCHGASGKGDGPLASELRKAPPDLTQFTKKNNGTFPKELVARIIDGREAVKGHGGGDMPVWGDAFARAQENADPESVKQKIQALVDYVETLQQK